MSAHNSDALQFPRVAARDLEGRARSLPDAFAGPWNLVIVAFRRDQQAMVDSWIAWFDRISARYPALQCYEVPVLATRWSPARGAIDGGMARAVHEREARRRTLTVYTDVRRLMDALAIDDANTVTALLVDPRGRVRWCATGPATEHAGSGLLAALADDAHEPPGELPAIEQFEFEFDARFRPMLAMIGVTPGTAHVTLARDRFVARFGPWTCETSISNVREVSRTGPYQWYKAIGPRGSIVDRGATFGTTAKGGVCVLFDEPVPALTPIGALRHPGITLTVAEPERFAASVRRRAGLV